MRFFKTNKQFLKGHVEGSKAGYNLALQQIEALLHAEMKKVARSKTITAKEVRLGELYWIIKKVKEFRK